MNQLDIIIMGITDTIFYIGCAFAGCGLYDFLKNKTMENANNKKNR